MTPQSINPTLSPANPAGEGPHNPPKPSPPTRIFRLYCRWRHTRGFGVHSPFAFRLVTEAIRPSRRYAYYAELDPGMSPLHRLQLRVNIFMRQNVGQPPTDNLEQWLSAPQRPLLLLNPSPTAIPRIESRMQSANCGLLIRASKYLIAIARPQMALVTYDLL